MASGIADRVRYMGTAWAAMAPRERRLVTLLGLVFGGLVAAGLWWWVASGLQDREDRVQRMREALDVLIREADTLRQAKMARARVDARLETSSVPMLQAYVDKVAQEVGLEVKEYKSLKPRFLDKKKRYRERSVRLRILGVDLDSLSRFMDKLEGGKDLVMVTELRISTRTGQPDKLDVDMVVSTFEKAEKVVEKKAKARPRAAARKAR